MNSNEYIIITYLYLQKFCVVFVLYFVFCVPYIIYYSANTYMYVVREYNKGITTGTGGRGEGGAPESKTRLSVSYLVYNDYKRAAITYEY